ncbi:MAG: hypothetical protein Q8K78_10790 [Planctomycetaceae bacterium]|nr:hypothetical protein [Planctomycetaceae bacterium]
MIRKLVIGALAVAGLMVASGEVSQADARPRVRVYSGPYGTTVRWRGDGYSYSNRYYRDARRYYRPYYRPNVSIGIGQPYGWGPTYPYSSGGVYVYPSPGVIYHY